MLKFATLCFFVLAPSVVLAQLAPERHGPITAPALTIQGPGSTGDVSGMSVTGTVGGRQLGEWFADVVNVKPAAKGDGVALADASIAAGTSVLTSASAAFSQTDTGKLIIVVGAGPLAGGTAFGATLATTIQSVSDAHTAVLAATATTTVSATRAVYGTDDRAAIQNAINATSRLRRRVVLPDGIYLHSGDIYIPSGRAVEINGQSQAGTILTAAAAMTDQVVYYNGAISGAGLRDLTLDGSFLAGVNLDIRSGSTWKVRDIGIYRTAFNGIGFRTGSDAQGYFGGKVHGLSISYPSNDYKAASLLPNYGLYSDTNTFDSDFEVVNVQNSVLAGIYEGGSNNRWVHPHPFGYPLPTYNPVYGMRVVGYQNRISDPEFDGGATALLRVEQSGTSLSNPLFVTADGNPGAIPAISLGANASAFSTTPPKLASFGTGATYVADAGFRTASHLPGSSSGDVTTWTRSLQIKQGPDGNARPAMVLDAYNGSFAPGLLFRSNGVNRFALEKSGDETGSANGGGDLAITPYSDNGTALPLAFKAIRATQQVLLANSNFSVLPLTSSVNYGEATGAIAGTSPKVTAKGSDTNIDMLLAGKGTGGGGLIDGNGQYRVRTSTLNVAFNGASMQPRPTLPAALPADGTATNAQLAAAYNSLRSALINYGLAQ